MLLGYQCWMNPQQQSLWSFFTESQQLDHKAQFFGIHDVPEADLSNAFGGNLVDIHSAVKAEGSQDCQLISGISAF